MKPGMVWILGLLALGWVMEVHGDMYASMVELFDTNKDGQVDEVELLRTVAEGSGKAASFGHAQLQEARRLLDRVGGGSSARLYELMRERLPGEPILSSAPEQVHLAMNGSYDVMHVYWITNAETTESWVWWGSQSGELTQQASGQSWTYDAGLLGWSGRVHHAEMSGLSAVPRVYYRVGSSSALQSAERSFAGPALKQAQYPLRIALYGDMGTYVPMGYAVTEQMVVDASSTPFDLVHHVGDVAYAGVNSDGELEFIWDVWGRQIEPLASQFPYQFAVGNHEQYNDFAAFRNRFLTATNGNGSFYYSYNYGPVHMVSMCTEEYVVSYQPGSPQYQWLENDLAKAAQNRAEVPWIILTGHRPMYSSDRAQDSGPLTSVIEPLMRKYGVDMYVSGHMHEVTLTYPVAQSQAVMAGVQSTGSGSWLFRNPDAPVHYIVGTSGAMIDEHFVEPQPDWVAWRNGTIFESPYGYAVLEVANSSHLHFDFRLEFDGQRPIDLWIIKD